jgi:hypothetical protein
MKARLPSLSTELAMKTSQARLPTAQAPAHHAALAPDEHVASAPALQVEARAQKSPLRVARCALRAL